MQNIKPVNPSKIPGTTVHNELPKLIEFMFCIIIGFLLVLIFIRLF